MVDAAFDEPAPATPAEETHGFNEVTIGGPSDNSGTVAELEARLADERRKAEEFAARQAERRAAIEAERVAKYAELTADVDALEDVFVDALKAATTDPKPRRAYATRVAARAFVGGAEPVWLTGVDDAPLAALADLLFRVQHLLQRAATGEVSADDALLARVDDLEASVFSATHDRAIRVSGCAEAVLLEDAPARK